MVLYLWMMVQVVGESLPISSSGHIVLLQKIIERFYNIDFMLIQDLWAFDYILQGVSAIIFLLYFFPDWWQLIIDKPIKISSLLDTTVWKKNIAQVAIFGFIADGVTFLFWALRVADHIKIPLAIGFMITAGALWSMQYARQNKQIDIWSWKNALILGLVQGCALFPGISRFGATVAALHWLGYSGRLAFAISFLVQWPLIVAGSIKGLCSLYDPVIIETMCTIPFVIVTLFTGSIGYAVLCVVRKIIDRKTLWKFSYYMIIPSMLALLF